MLYSRFSVVVGGRRNREMMNGTTNYLFVSKSHMGLLHLFKVLPMLKMCPREVVVVFVVFLLQYYA